MRRSSFLPLPVLRRVRQGDDNVLVDEDEEGQEEAEAHRADDVHGRQASKWCQVEDGPVVNLKDGNCGKRRNVISMKQEVLSFLG